MLTTSSGPHYHQVQDQDQDEQRLEMRRISTLRYVFNKNPLYTILMLLLVTYYLTKEQAGIRETSAGPEHATGNAAMTKTSPNDARCVVWPHGEFISFFFAFFNTNSCFIVSINKLHYRECSHDENGPKRCQTRHLAPW